MIAFARDGGFPAARFRLFAGGQRRRDLLALNGSLRERLEQAAEQIAALELTLAQARQEALTDALTGLCNRRAFETAFADLAQQAAHTGAPLSLLLLDADHFKRINDRHGHPAGDQVLRLIARSLQEAVRRTDLVARYGGEEFAVLLPGTELRGAAALAETLRAGIAGRGMTLGKAESVGVTVSVGAASLERDEAPSDLVARADAALYAAKQAGRNLVRAL